MTIRSMALALAVLAFAGGSLRAQDDGEWKDAEVPAKEKTQELELVVTAAGSSGKMQIAALIGSPAEQYTWKFDAAAVLSDFEKALKDTDRLYARVAGTRTIDKLRVSAVPGSDRRILDCSFKLSKVKWIKSSDDWFLETQKLQKKGAEALSLLANDKLDQALAAYRDGQKIAEDMQYQTDPFVAAGSKNAAWGGVIEAIEKIQASQAQVEKATGDVHELTALLTLQYSYRYAIPELSPSLAPPESRDLDALMKTTRERFTQANARLLARLRKGEIKVSEADLAKIEEAWTLGMLSDLTYTFYMAGRYPESYQVARHAILTKTPEGTDWRRPLAQDVLYWVAKEERYTQGMPEAVLRKMPGDVKAILEKTQALDAHIAKDAFDALDYLKGKFQGMAWEPAIEPILEAIRPLVPPEEAPEGHRH
ncbi:MAG: hypothetical protein HYZ53_03885 [Planctomycetes bacterium]|nr:hypothetical protein [Planctomycetota bacterium]